MAGKKRPVFIKMNKVHQKKNQKSKGLMKVYWINLDRSVERKRSMMHQLTNFGAKHERISAVDGRHDLHHHEIESSWKCRGTTAAEYATTLSHIKAIAAAYRDHEAVAMIMEDDMKIIRLPNEYFLSLCPSDWDIIQMSATGSKAPFIYGNPRYYFLPWRPAYINSGGYLINRRGMIKVLAALAPKLLLKQDISILNKWNNIHMKVSFQPTKLRWWPHWGAEACNADYVIFILATTYTCCDLSMFEDRSFDSTIQTKAGTLAIHNKAARYMNNLYLTRGFLLDWD